LRALGVPGDEIERARQEGLVALLAVAASALPVGPRYTADELAERVGMPRDLSRRFWRALGFPDVVDDDPIFTDADVEALTTVNAMISMGFTTVETSMQLTRVIGSSLARIAEAMLSSQEERAAGPAPTPPSPLEGDLFALSAGASLETQSRLLDYVWRRHMQAASRRRLMSEARAGAPTAPLAIGFADLVGFTSLSQQISGPELARVVDRFEELAFDQVAGHGGRVAKMIGDEVMFVVDDPEAALETALSLAEAYADDEVLSDVRVGLSWGDVLTREGDYYGPVVNLASRIVNIALPGAVVISEPVHDVVVDDPRYVFHPLRQRNLKDIGKVRLWRVRRGHPSRG
jgi:adenylate cyclase